MIDTIESININEIEEYLDAKGIELIAFDIDNTLLQTGKYYLEAWLDFGKQVAPMVNNTEDPQKVSSDIRELILQGYFNDGKQPKLVDERVLMGLKEYLGKEPSDEIKNMAKEYYKDFYITSPEPFEYVIKLIKIFDSLNRKIVLHSHAQEEWTKIKVELLESLTGVNLPYKATPIANEKDGKSWLEAIEKVNSKVEKTLVIGDNFESDILSAIDIGCKHLIWIDLRKEGLPQDLVLKKDVELIVVNSLEEIPTRLKA
jgi:FMN phosphatase YigB (HAD superfamily)